MEILHHMLTLCVEDVVLFDFNLPESILCKTPDARNFDIEQMHVYYKGICEDCKKSEEN